MSNTELYTFAFFSVTVVFQAQKRFRGIIRISAHQLDTFRSELYTFYQITTITFFEPYAPLSTPIFDSPNRTLTIPFDNQLYTLTGLNSAKGERRYSTVPISGCIPLILYLNKWYYI